MRNGCCLHEWLPAVLTQRSIILGEDWLREVWYCVEIDSAQYHTALRLTPRSMILQGDFTTNFNDWLCAVWYCREIDSPQCDTVGRLTQCSFILRGDWLCALGAVWYWSEIQKNLNNSAKNLTNRKYFNPLVQMILKKLGVKNLVGLSL